MGQDTAIALADVIKCVVIIHIAFLELQSFRLKCMPIMSPIQLAFFEPGHYMAVMPRLYEPLRLPKLVDNNNDNQSLTSRDDRNVNTIYEQQDF